MDVKKLPAEFLDEMKQILGNEYPVFLTSFDSPVRKGLRINRLKVDVGENEAGHADENLIQNVTPGNEEADSGDVQRTEELPEGVARMAREAGFHLTRIPWTDNGYFYDEKDQPSRHPFYSAGLYYLQEPSAMAPAQILPVEPGDRVLDLCAAPGGKTTELGARLKGRGLLVANEISSTRVRALVRNVNLFGIANACVTSTDSAHLLARFPGYFDRVLVDAPCSGEGMFRKDEEAVNTWSREKVMQCAAIQRQIIVDAADMVRPGGMMMYSTCTFAPEEDEMTILHLLKERPEMELVPILREGGRAGFAPGLSIERLKELGYLDGEEAAAAESAQKSCGSYGQDAGEAPDLTFTCRLWPHRIQGEGHFMALLRKRGGENPDSGKKSGKKTRKKTGNGKAQAAGTCRQGLTAEQRKLIHGFIQPYLQGKEAQNRLPLDWKLEGDRLEVHDGKVYYMPDGIPAGPGIKTMRAGIYLGELKKNRFEPEQELAMALPAWTIEWGPEWGQALSGAENTSVNIDNNHNIRGDDRKNRNENRENMRNKKKICNPQKYLTPSEDSADSTEDMGLYVSLGTNDTRLESYLHGNAIQVKQAFPNGWRLLCAGRYPIGWGKLVNGQLKNKYPAGWRIPG